MTARIGAPKTGGRKRGSIDREARKLLTDQMAGDLMTVYRKLGGVKWLLKFAEDNPKEFLQQGLARLFPAPQRDDSDFTQNNQFNFTANPIEAARRIAFVLESGLRSDPSRVIDITPEAVETCVDPNQWTPPTDVPDMLPPEPPSMTPVPDPQRQQWASELPLTDQERADQQLLRETKQATISTYAGSGAEHGSGGGGHRQPQVQTKRTVNQIRRDQLL